MKSLLIALCCTGVVIAQTTTLTHGPLRGHVDATSMHVWARASEPGEFTLELLDVVGDAVKRAHAVAAREHDLTLHFTVSGLMAGTGFGLRILAGEVVVHESHGMPWTTAIADDAAAATIAFGSCADERGHPEQPIWERIVARTPDALVLLGDTPYIDDGTVEGRRRRHRAFLEFEPIAQALAAIPTWTTWDDHDYATNDMFGGAKGSETARSVFVEYHAHAGYGDGTRGIYTRCRRGPMEVFLLDARTFADTEKSALAPGERSLLGKAQTEWLQHGLRASTATFKVLACGMVWNGGVRPNKADCWGNWLAERDGLFRWIGEQGVEGVVLVSGDVHRSRVILHPTTALAGYDIPEFVTSPLAQNVLESNKVDVPGLEFDAGEASTCLFLSAAAGVDRDALVATFVAGDGREFHRRAFAAPDLGRGDAAVVYRRVETMLQAAFGVDFAGLPETDYEARGGVQIAGAVLLEWRAAVAAAAPALAEWGKAAALPRCRFGAKGEQEGTTEFFDRLQGILRLRTIAMARGFQAIADRDEATLLATCEGLLVLARHLCDEPTTIAWLQAFDIESCTVQLATTTAADWPASAPVLRASLLRHLAVRPSLGAIAVPAEQESVRLLDLALRETAAKDGVQGALARGHGTETRRLCIAAIGEHVAPLLRLGNTPDATVRAELGGLGNAFTVQIRDVRARMKARKASDPPQPTDAADLATLLLSLVVPNVVDLHDQAVAIADELQAAATAR